MLLNLQQTPPASESTGVFLRVWKRMKAYECRIYLCPDETGGFFVFLPNLPGVVSEGETEEKALEAIAEAFRGAVKAYRHAGEEIPWTGDSESEQRPADARELRVVIDA